MDMFVKLLLCLPLVLSGIEVIQAEETNAHATTNATHIRSEFILKTNWTDTTVTVYRSSGGPVKLPARYAIVTAIWGFFTNDFIVTAFVDPDTGNAWFGSDPCFSSSQETQLYCETTEGIFQGTVLFDVVALGGAFPNERDITNGSMACGEIIWLGSLIPHVAPKETVQALIDQNDKKGTWKWAMEERGLYKQSVIEHRLWKIENDLNPWLFVDKGHGPQRKFTTIKAARANNGKLQLDLLNPDRTHRASVWVDLDTWKVIKVIQDG